MALSHNHRSSIYEHLSPIIREDEAEALLYQFPARDLDEPVTKDFVMTVAVGVATSLAQLIG